MSKVVVKGESVYQCDDCNRRVRVPANKQGIDVLQRCIITYGCRGSLRRLTQAKDINSTPAFPPEVQGVQDWFQRRVLYTHTQPVDALVWKVSHNLANQPIIHPFIYAQIGENKQLIATEDFTTRTLDLNTTEVTFPTPVSGIIQAITLSSQNTTNPEPSKAAVDAALTQITSNTGELTVAIRINGTGNWNDPLIDITLDYATRNQLVIVYPSIDASPSIESPWVGAERAVINGKNYALRSFNIVNTLPATPHFASGEITNGTAFRLTKINNMPVNSGDVLVALGRSPFAAVDRITDKMVDAGKATFTYDLGKAFVDTKFVKSIYPFITVV